MSSFDLNESPHEAHSNEYIGDRLLPVGVLFILVDIVCVALRLYARHLSKARPGYDDYLTVLSLLLCLGLIALALASVTYGGVGYHFVLFRSQPSVLVAYMKLEFASMMVYLAAVTLPKLAILSLYLRIFCERFYRLATYVLAGILIANFLSNCLALSASCIPLKALWDRTVPDAHCVDLVAYYRYSSLPNILTDLFMLVLPLPVIWRMCLSTRDKIGLTLTFGAGSIGLIASILRFSAFMQSANTATIDPTWIAVKLEIYGIIEASVYLIAACLPNYRGIIFHFRDVRSQGQPAKSGYLSATQSTGLPRYGNTNPRLDQLQSSTPEFDYGNVAAAFTRGHEGDPEHLIGPVKAKVLYFRPPSPKADPPHTNVIEVRRGFSITSRSK